MAPLIKSFFLFTYLYVKFGFCF